MFESWVIPVITVLTLVYVIANRLYFSKKTKRSSHTSFVFDESELLSKLAKYTPKPIAPVISDVSKLSISSQKVVDSSCSREIKVRDAKTKDAKVVKTVVNFGTADFLGFNESKEVNAAAKKAMDKYGCGACGPRGFYGTFDVMLDLEKRVAKFLNVDDCIMYSDSYSTATSVLSAFAARDDVLVADECVSEVVLTGMHLSRATVHFYKHNDMADLERILSKVMSVPEKQLKREDGTLKRRIIVTEAIFRDVGDFAKLKEIVPLKEKYKFRLFVDETLSFGTLGATGRGLWEELGVPLEEIDFLVGAMDYACASFGGFCAGNLVVIEHQRLKGPGYVFSAATPPFLTQTALTCIDLLDTESVGKAAVKKLRQNCEVVSNLIRQKATSVWLYESDPKSPVIILRSAKEKIDAKSLTQRFKLDKKLRDVADKVGEKGFFIVVPSYATSEPDSSNKDSLSYALPQPCLKLIISSKHTQKDLEGVVQALVDAGKSIL